MSMAQVERELGITPYLLSKWVQQFREAELSPFPGKGHARDEEIRRLQREIAILKQERDILKKQSVSSPTQNDEICGHSSLSG